MVKIRNMKVSDVDKVAELVAPDYDNDEEKGYSEAKQHTFDHLKNSASTLLCGGNR